MYSLESWTIVNASNLQVPKIEHRQPLPTSKLVCSLVLSAYMRDHLDFVSYFARHSASQMSLVTDPIIHLPTDWKQYSVLVSPFVHAKFKQIFEKKTHKRCIQVYDGHPETVRAWVDYVVKKMPAGIDVHVDQYQWVPLDYQPPEEPPRPLRLSEKKSFETLVKEKADEYLKKFSS
jgi:ribosomal protein S10